MRVLLFSPGTGLYYGGRDQWVSDQARACDFQEDVQLAVQCCLEEKLLPVELVLCYDNPSRTFNLPLRARLNPEPARCSTQEKGSAGAVLEKALTAWLPALLPSRM